MIQTAIQLKTAASGNAITTQEAKDHLRVDSSDDDTYVAGLVVAAQRTVESFTNLVLNDTVYYFHLSAFPVDGIVLPFSPIKSIESITYYDSAGDEQTLSTGDYYYHISQKPFELKYTGGTPGTSETKTNAVTVEFTCGYTSPEAIPEELKHAIKLLLTDMYENRADAPREKFTAWKSLAYPHRVFHSTTENI